MSTLIEVPPGGLTEAICSAVRTWSDVAEAGQLRISPNPISPTNYLILNGSSIVATLRVVDPAPRDLVGFAVVDPPTAEQSPDPATRPLPLGDVLITMTGVRGPARDIQAPPSATESSDAE